MDNELKIKALNNILDNPADNLSNTSRDIIKTMITSLECDVENEKLLPEKIKTLFNKNEFFKPIELVDDIIGILFETSIDEKYLFTGKKRFIKQIEFSKSNIKNEFNEINSDIPVWSIKAVTDDKRKTFYQLIRKDSKAVYFAGYNFEFISEYVNKLNSLNNPRRVNIENRVNDEIELWVCDGLHEKNEACNYVKIL